MGVTTTASPPEGEDENIHNVIDYGAVGDGATDAFSAIQRAANAAAGGGPLFPEKLPSPYVDKSKLGNMDPNSRRAALARLGKARDRSQANELPQWVKLSLLEHELLGKTWNQIHRSQSKKMGRSEKAIQKQLGEYRKSPAAAAFIENLAPLISDPIELGKAILRANAANVAVENIVHYEAAKEAGDVAEAGRQLRFITEAIGMPSPKKVENQSPTSINITFSGGTITAELPMGDSEGTKVIEAEIVEE